MLKEKEEKDEREKEKERQRHLLYKVFYKIMLNLTFVVFLRNYILVNFTKYTMFKPEGVLVSLIFRKLESDTRCVLFNTPYQSASNIGFDVMPAAA